MQDLDFDNILFGGTPLSRLADIFQVANKNLIESEVSKFLLRFAAIEELLEQKGVSEREIELFMHQNEERLQDAINSLAITLAAEIVTRNE